MQLKLLIVYGGESAERHVSEVTAESCLRELQKQGHEIWLLDPAKLEPAHAAVEHGESRIIRSTAPHESTFGAKQLAHFVAQIERVKPQLVFNCLHGGAGEDGRLAALCDLLGVPISSSPAMAAEMAMDKDFSKGLMARLGIPTAPWFVLKHSSEIPETLPAGLSYPLVVKPNSLGSSVGIQMVKNRRELGAAATQIDSLGDRILLEAFLPGREVTCAMVGDELLPIVEIHAEEGWYDYEHKYSGGCRYICPARISDELDVQIKHWTRELTQFMGCRGITRTDWRLDDAGVANCLEVNTVPGMTATSLVPKAAAAAGLDFGALLRRQLELFKS